MRDFGFRIPDPKPRETGGRQEGDRRETGGRQEGDRRETGRLNKYLGFSDLVARAG